MSDKPAKPESGQPAEEADAPSRLGNLVAGIRSAAIVHWRRTIALLVTVLLLMVGIGIAWTYMVNLAIEGERAKLDEALADLDQGHYEQARTLVRHVLNSGAVPRSEHGTPLFVLGAVKNTDASSEIVAEQRQTQYLVASRYLNEARTYGFPTGREKQGLLLLGKSLVESNQGEQSIPVLMDALEVKPTAGGQLNAAIHRLLADAYLLLSTPNFDRALEQIDATLDEKDLLPEQRVDALVLKAKTLARIGRFSDALKSIATVPAESENDPNVLVARAKILLDGVTAALEHLPIQKQGKLPPALDAQMTEAEGLLKQAQKLDTHTTEVTRRALFLLARAAELRGDESLALQLYTRTQQKYGDSPEGLAAKLAEADILRRSGDDVTALLWYRQVLQSEIDPAHYRSDVLPLDELRLRILRAVSDFVRNESYENAITMLEYFPPLFSRTQELALRGKTLREWGERELAESAEEGKHSQELRRTGLRRLREAGMAYEQLAQLRFAAAEYPTDLWDSADCYYLGHSYTNAARLLDIYLQNEPEKRNAEALLRLGQVTLALGRIDESIAALDECIELYDRDNATYQARIDCAKAHMYRGEAAESERLLRTNLTESLLEPKSPEWKDSLFALGMLLFEQGRYDEAISTLEEAVERYPEDRQALLARYVTGEAYRRWAAEPLARAETARTASEREKNEQQVQERLNQALAQFKAVQSSITLQVQNVQDDVAYGAMRRNCYMLEGACLFDLGRYQDAIEAYQNVSSLYPNEPFVLETFVQIAHCWQRLDRAENAHGAIEQAELSLQQMPANADFAATTAFSREEWRMLLDNLRK